MLKMVLLPPHLQENGHMKCIFYIYGPGLMSPFTDRLTNVELASILCWTFMTADDLCRPSGVTQSLHFVCIHVIHFKYGHEH